MKFQSAISVFLICAASSLVLSSCAAPVSKDFRARLWEKCYIAGQKEFQKGHQQAALGLFEEALKQSSGFDERDDRRTDTSLALANCLFSLKRVDRARPIYEQVAKKSSAILAAGGREDIWLPLQGRALSGLGDCQRLGGELRQSVETYKLAIESLEKSKLSADHGFDVGGEAMGRAYEGLCDSLVGMGNINEAVKPLSEAAKISDWTVGLMDWKQAVKHKYISSLWAVGQDNNALSESTASWSEPMHQALEAADRGDVKSLRLFVDEAEMYLTGNADIAPSRAVTHLYLALAAYHEGKFNNAIEDAKTGLEVRNKDPFVKVDQVASDLYGVLGLSEEGLGKYKEAAEHLRASVDIDSAAKLQHPMHTAARLAQLATVEQKLGNQKDAEHDIQRAETLADGGGRNGWSRGVAEYWQARYYLSTGDKSKARALLEDALPRMEKRPNHIVMARAKELLSSL